MMHRKTRSDNFNFLPGSLGSSVPAEGTSQEATRSCSMDTDQDEQQEACEAGVADPPPNADRARLCPKGRSTAATSQLEDKTPYDAEAPMAAAQAQVAAGWPDGLPPGHLAGRAFSHSGQACDLPTLPTSGPYRTESSPSLTFNQNAWTQPCGDVLGVSSTACSSNWLANGGGGSFSAGWPPAGLLFGHAPQAFPFTTHAQHLTHGHVRSLSHGFIDMQQQQQLTASRLSLGAPCSLPDLPSGALSPLPPVATVPDNCSAGFGSTEAIVKGVTAGESGLVTAVMPLTALGCTGAAGFDIMARGSGSGSRGVGDVGAAAALALPCRGRQVSESGRTAVSNGASRSRARVDKATAGGGDGSEVGEGLDALEATARGRERSRQGNGKTSRELLLLDPKRVRRIIANRQSAAKSKERKQQYTEQLVQLLDNSSEEREALNRQLERLRMDGVTLEGHVLQVRQETQRLTTQLAAVRRRGEVLLQQLWTARVAAGQEPSQPVVEAASVEAAAAAADLLPTVVGMVKEGLSTEDLEALEKAGCPGGILLTQQQQHAVGPCSGIRPVASGVMTAVAAVRSGLVGAAPSAPVGSAGLQSIPPNVLPQLTSQQDLAPVPSLHGYAQQQQPHSQQQRPPNPPPMHHQPQDANGSLALFPTTQPLPEHQQHHQQQRRVPPRPAALGSTTAGVGAAAGPALHIGSAAGLPVPAAPGYHRPTQSADAATMMSMAPQLGGPEALGPGMPIDLAPGHRLLNGGGRMHTLTDAGADGGMGAGFGVGLLLGGGLDPAAAMMAAGGAGGFSLSLPGPMDVLHHHAAAEALAAAESQAQAPSVAGQAVIATGPVSGPGACGLLGVVGADGGLGSGGAVAVNVSTDLGLSRLCAGAGGGLGLFQAAGGLAAPCTLGGDQGLLAVAGTFTPGDAGVGLGLLGDPAGLQDDVLPPPVFPSRQVTTALRPPVTTNSWRP